MVDIQSEILSAFQCASTERESDALGDTDLFSAIAAGNADRA